MGDRTRVINVNDDDSPRVGGTAGGRHRAPKVSHARNALRHDTAAIEQSATAAKRYSASPVDSATTATNAVKSVYDNRRSVTAF